MKMRTVFLILALTVFLGSLVFYNTKTTSAEDQAVPAAITAKLDQILQNQETILQKLDDIGQELNIVKVRATRK
jgi:hypothetical protein